jgi:TonB-dependent SusC/RagA subfamily outer membrane receptor
MPAVHGVVLPIEIRKDTSDRLFGSHDVPRSLGASMGVIDSAMLATSHARTLSELLTARVPGVSVMRSSGIVGGGSRVRLRGATGIYATREPIVIVDGVRVDAIQSAPGLSIGGQQPSRLDDIDVDQIARIEVLRGPAASALYGTNGAGGVIRITTRAPSRGQTSWATYAEGGIATDLTGYPANYSTGSGITGEANLHASRRIARRLFARPARELESARECQPVPNRGTGQGRYEPFRWLARARLSRQRYRRARAGRSRA